MTECINRPCEPTNYRCPKCGSPVVQDGEAKWCINEVSCDYYVNLGGEDNDTEVRELRFD